MRNVELFLYETYALQQRRSFARTKDSERGLTVTLAAGRATIINDRFTRAEDEENNRITKAYPGQEIKIRVRIRNDGDTDWVWMTVKDKDTGAIIKNKNGLPFNFETDLMGGAEWDNRFREVIMPNKNWNLLVEAGHGRA